MLRRNGKMAKWCNGSNHFRQDCGGQRVQRRNGKMDWSDFSEVLPTCPTKGCPPAPLKGG